MLFNEQKQPRYKSIGLKPEIKDRLDRFWKKYCFHLKDYNTLLTEMLDFLEEQVQEPEQEEEEDTEEQEEEPEEEIEEPMNTNLPNLNPIRKDYNRYRMFE